MSLLDELKSNPLLRPIKPLARRFADTADIATRHLRSSMTPFALTRYDNLHLGCGPRKIEGWANVDLYGFGNITWDLRKPLPVKPRSIQFIYSEHFIEHIPRDAALKLMKNCRNLLTSDGVIRLSTPSLRRLAEDYVARKFPELPKETWNPTTLCSMVNEGMRSWGHQYLYDEEELALLLSQAGFSDLKRAEWGNSEHLQLRGLETRPYHGDIIIEARA